MGFHSQDNLKYGEASINKALASGQITKDDANLIREYATEYQATRHVSNLRVLKSIFELVNWRRFIQSPYREVTITQIHKALNDLNTENSLRGKPFKDNTKHDYVKGLKWFLHWMICEGHSKLLKEKVDKIKVPSVDSCTTTPDGILQEDDILAMVTQARTFRDKALLFVLYESGCRIGELARIKWKDVVFNDDSTVGLTLFDTKTRKIRHALLGASVEYLAGWRNNYPGTPDNDNFVFVSVNGEPMEYRAMSQIISRTAKKAGLEKRVTPHLFRKSRITSLIKQNYQESVIKQAMWGNLDTDMFKTYVVLSEQDIDAEFREKMGIKQKEIKKDKKMAPRQCKSCFAMNGPQSNFCHVCGKPLTEVAVQELEYSTDTLRNLLAENPTAQIVLLELLNGLKTKIT
ncbi:MAG: tyrosine-type recombinase/integrase [Methanoregulaceae archaeon]|jgi:site-specific recombinase XerD